MPKPRFDELEEEALQRLSKEELDTFNRVLEAYIKAGPIDRELIVPSLTYNLGEFNAYARHIKYGYYEGFDTLVKRAYALLKQARVTADGELLELIDEALKIIEDILGKEVESYYYDYAYPYTSEQKVRRYREFQKQALAEILNRAREYEDAKLKEEARDNLLGDLVIETYNQVSHGGNAPTSDRQKEFMEKWTNLDWRIANAIKSIQEELRAEREYRERLQQLESSKDKAKNQFLSKQEEKRKVAEKLLEQAVSYILKRE